MLLWLATACAQGDVDVLLGRLSSEDIEARESALRELLRIGAPAREGLRALRGSASPDTAHLARRALGRIDWDRALPPAFRGSPRIPFDGLGSEDPAQFEAALIATRNVVAGNFSPPPGEDDARSRLLFQHAGVRDDARLRGWAEGLDAEAFWGPSPGFARSLFFHLEHRSWKGERFDWLRPLLGSPARSHRMLAALVLAQEGDSAALPVLTEAVGDPLDLFCVRVPFYLGRARYAPALPRFLEQAARGDLQGFQAVTQYGWDGHVELLREIADRHSLAHVPWMAHKELARRGDLSRLPRLLEHFGGWKSPFLTSFDTVVLDAALAYDTPEAARAVLRVLDHVEVWGAHGLDTWVRFQSRGARVVWERYLDAPTDQTEFYLGPFCAPEHLAEPARRALTAEVPPRVMTKAARILLRLPRLALDPGELDALRPIAAAEKGADRPATTLLLNRDDVGTLRRLIDEDALHLLESRPFAELGDLLVRTALRPGAARADAVRLLSRQRDAATAELLVRLLADPGVRQEAATGLQGFPDRLLRAHLDVLGEIPAFAERFRPKPEPCADPAWAWDPALRLEGYKALGAEDVDILLDAVRTEKGDFLRAAMTRLSELGGADARVFLAECIRDPLRAPDGWALLAARLGDVEALPALRSLLEREADPLALKAMDAIANRAAYARIREARPGRVVETDLAAAFREIGEAHGLAVRVSPALEAAFRRQMSPEGGGRNFAMAGLEVDLGGSLQDLLLRYAPEVTQFHGVGNSGVISPKALLWAPLLEDGVLNVLTPEEARSRRLPR